MYRLSVLRTFSFHISDFYPSAFNAFSTARWRHVPTACDTIPNCWSIFFFISQVNSPFYLLSLRTAFLHERAWCKDIRILTAFVWVEWVFCMYSFSNYHFPLKRSPTKYSPHRLPFHPPLRAFSVILRIQTCLDHASLSLFSWHRRQFEGECNLGDLVYLFIFHATMLMTAHIMITCYG